MTLYLILKIILIVGLVILLIWPFIKREEDWPAEMEIPLPSSQLLNLFRTLALDVESDRPP